MSGILNSRKLEAINKTNVAKLSLVALFLTLLDTVQSYYGQRVLNIFTEFNALPAIYYSHGIEGYILYTPIEFGAIFVTIGGLWLWASYVIWFYQNFVQIKFTTWIRNP
jgi:hypothetical protein